MDTTKSDDATEIISANAKMFDIRGQAVIGTTVEGKIVYWSDSATRLYGWLAEDVIGRSILAVIPTDTTRDEAAKIMTELASGRTWTGKFGVRDHSGRELTVHVRDVPVRDQNGTLVGIVGISSRVPD